MSSLCPAVSTIGLKNITEISKNCKLYWGGEDFTSLCEKAAKMSNMPHNFVRLECGILTDISSPPSPTFKYTLPLKIKDSLLEYHRSKFPLIVDYIHSSKYRVPFYKVQNPYRNWCDVTHNMCIGSRQIQKCARKVSSYNNLRDIDMSTCIFL